MWMRAKVTAYYFGCWRSLGHYLWNRGTDGHPYSASRDERRLLGGPTFSREPEPPVIPWGYSLDGGLLKDKSLRQGEAVVERRDGWTAVSFWDRSVDSRPGSSSTFVFDAELDDDAALATARELFPPIFARFDFPVLLAINGVT